MQSLSTFLGAFCYILMQNKMNLETTPLNAAVYEFTSRIVEEQVGGIS